MTFQVIHFLDGGNARSPFRVIEQPMGREVDWINRFLDRECVRRLAENTLRSYAMDLLDFLRWWESMNHTVAIREEALSATVLMEYLRFQTGEHPQPAAAAINRRMGVVERALRNEFPDAASPFVPGFHHFYWRRSPLVCSRPRPTLSRLRVKEPKRCQRRLNIPQFPPVENSPLRRLKFPQVQKDCRHAPALQARAWEVTGAESALFRFPYFVFFRFPPGRSLVQPHPFEFRQFALQVFPVVFTHLGFNDLIHKMGEVVQARD
jgi:hypothetical protein